MQACSRSLQLNSISNTRVTREWFLHGGCSSPPPPSGLRTAGQGQGWRWNEQAWLCSRPRKEWAHPPAHACPTSVRHRLQDSAQPGPAPTSLQQRERLLHAPRPRQRHAQPDAVVGGCLAVRPLLTQLRGCAGRGGAWQGQGQGSAREERCCAAAAAAVAAAAAAPAAAKAGLEGPEASPRLCAPPPRWLPRPRTLCERQVRRAGTRSG